MLTVDNITAYTLQDITLEKNEKLKKELLNLRTEILLRLPQNRITKNIIMENHESSIEEIATEVEHAYTEHTSTLYFPGDICCFYPRIQETKAKNLRTCDISGCQIFPGTHYYSYRPLIDNLTSGKTFVLKRTIQTEIGYYDFLPKTLYELENLVFNLGNPYEIENKDYNYYELSKTLGEYLPLQELRKRR